MSDFTMGLAQIMSGETTRIRKEPNKSVKLYTLIKDYAQRKYNADDSTVMKLYIGTKHAAEITDNGALIDYVDGKLKPNRPKQPEPIVPDEPIDNTEQTQSEIIDDMEQMEQPKKHQRPEQLELDFGQNDDIMAIRENILNVDVARYKNKIRITVTEPDRDLELAYKMKQLGYKYKTKRGLSYFFVKL